MTARAAARARLAALVADAGRVLEERTAALVPEAEATKLRAEWAAAWAAGTPARKSVDDETENYRALIMDWCEQVFAGRMTKVDLARALRGLIRAEAQTVYVAGLEAGDVAEEDMDDEDDAAIDEWIAGQLEYVSGFAADAVAARGDADAQDAIGARVEAWAAAFRALGTLGTMSAKKNQTAVWHFGDTDHCETCSKLNGSKHRLSWFIDNGYIPQEPGSESLACHGFNCRCELRDTSGKVLVP